MMRNYIVTAVLVIVAAIAFFTIGLLMRRRSDAELISELESELDARQEADLRMITVPVEVAHEPVPPPLIVSEDPASLAYWHGLDAADTMWDMPAVRLEGIEELDIWTATIIASTDRFLLRLGIAPAR